MEKEEFVKRITELRMNKGVSAREMSLSTGMGEHYINRLENGAGLPNMETFFVICEYLGISEKDFFDFEPNSQSKLSRLLKEAMSLTDEQLDAAINMITAMKK